MEYAIRLATEAGDAGEVPVGAVVVRDREIVGRGRNRMRKEADPRAHAEIDAIDDARHRTGTARLDGDTLYVTLEPCPMCAGAIALVRLGRVVFGARDPRFGASGSQFDVLGAGILGDVAVRAGVLEARCSRLLSDWFRREREGAESERTGRAKGSD
jgi:tRNA(adenine34) deaminase